ncbi:MAG: hypothetical protein KJO66_01675 [Gammaproteobacteria bacterium]|nr:hypothetical protein [Gammaproteobacteria bacterium]
MANNKVSVMVNDKRIGEQVSLDELRGQLNEEQRMTLGELELLGWKLKFIRMPLFQDPVPVVVSRDNSQIGMLDSEGKIVVDQTSIFRGEEFDSPVADAGDVAEFDEVSVEAEAEAESAAEADWVEKRRGESPVPDNLEDYLNDEQLTALRQIQAFGWELKFVRRPLFQDPVAVIINNDGDRLGTLETDGRIELRSDFNLREETVEAPTDEDDEDGADKKLVGS